MNDVLLAQLIRQLKIINFWISVFGTLILAVLLVLGYLVFKVVTFVDNTNKKIDSISQQTKESLDFKAKLCSTNSVGGFLADKTKVCNE
jgi:hypothetical protein